MFFKQYNYKPRSGSTSSQGSASGQMAGSPPKEEPKMSTTTSSTTQQPTGSISAATAGRRRSSASGADKFAGLQGLKRNSQDTERKASWAEQKSGQSGILGGMWNSFTKGS